MTLPEPGQRRGEWQVIERAANRRGAPYFLARCSCGVEREVRGAELGNGTTRSCGHAQRKQQEANAYKRGVPIKGKSEPSNTLDSQIARMQQVLDGTRAPRVLHSSDSKRLPGARPHLKTAAPAPPQGPWFIKRKPNGQAYVQVDLSEHPGQAAAMASKARLTAVLSGVQSGKMLSIDTPIATPAGWTTMGQLEVGHSVFDADGLPTRVSLVSPIVFSAEAYRVRFDDGTSVLADAEHLWVTQTRLERRRALPFRSGIRSTREIAETLVDRQTANHSVDISPGPKLPESELPIPPYTLGIWLADGTSSAATITTPDEEVLREIAAEGVAIGAAKEVNAGKARGYRLGGSATHQRNALGQWSGGNTLNAKLRESGLLGNKHIPQAYLFASREQRLALLQGLMDGDGHIMARGAGASCELSCSNARLAADASMLIRGLGIKLRVHTRVPTLHGKPMKLNYRLTFSTDQAVFRIARKVERLRVIRADMRRRFVVACEPVPSVPMRCISVDSPSQQYLCTTDYITTHNTSLGPVWLEREIRMNGPGDYLAVTATYPLLQRKMLPEFRRFFESMNLGKWTAGDKIFLFHDGETRVLFGSAKNPESLESATGKAAWLDEAGQAQFTLEAKEAIDRRLSLYQGRTFISTTPYVPGWMKIQVNDPALAGQVLTRQYPRGLLTVAGDAEVCLIQFPSALNPSFPYDEMLRQRDKLPTWKYRMFYEGRFDKPPGLIYSDYEDTYREAGGHLVKPFPIPAWWPRYLGLDFGGTNLARIWVAHDPVQDVYYIYNETLKGGLTVAQHVQEILTDLAGAPLNRVFGGAGSEDNWRREFAAVGLVIEEPALLGTEQTVVELGIDRVIGLLKARRLLIFDICKGLRSEFGGYSRETDEAGNPIDKIMDKAAFHRLDAVRYLCAGIGGPPEPVPVLSMRSTRRGWMPRY